MQPLRTEDNRAWANDLARPWPVLAVALCLLNDHLLKASRFFPGWLTGKLSDFAGLFFFPLLLVAMAELAARLTGQRLPRRRPLARGMVVLTGMGFALVKLVPATHALLPRGFVIAPDATDLVALAMLPLSASYLARPRPGCWPAWRRLLIVTTAAAASIATSRAPQGVPLAYWEVPDRPFTQNAGCANLSGWVSKSGKTGLGLTLRAWANEPGCQVQIAEGTLRVDGQSVRLAPPPAAALAAHVSRYLYLPFPFDNHGAWMRGVREAELHLTLSQPLPRELRIPLRQRVLAPLLRTAPIDHTSFNCLQAAFYSRIDPEARTLFMRVELSSPDRDCRVRFRKARLVGTQPNEQGAWQAVTIQPSTTPTETEQPVPTTWTLSFPLPEGRHEIPVIAIDLATSDGSEGTIETTELASPGEYTR